ncbi:MAG: YtxH domain-containing protein [Patescibacteria group bacterium]
MFKPRSTGQKFALGAVLAGVVGFIVGILAAPKSGKETREDLKSSTKIAIGQAEKDLKVAHTELKQLIATAQTAIKDTSKQAKKDFKKAIARAKKSQSKVKVVLSSIHDGTSDDPELKKALDEAIAARSHLKKFFKNK